MPKKPRGPRPRITPEVEQDVRKLLDTGRTFEQITNDIDISLASVFRIQKTYNVEKAATVRAERRMWLGKIKKLLMTGSKYNATEAQKLIYDATGEKV